ncbi:MAG: Glu-tRNA(Gln) amidotransferase subunit GatD [Nitrososphaera sp.]|uniref:Glu-tRNA(Gln) amidotransferase subunit GatD n=1 Tax=Nitrososphaera sp. TaxID=1971748 RepID=UPI003D6EC710
MSGDSGGYRGAGLRLLSMYGVCAGDAVSVVTAEGEMSGILMPRYESASEDYIVIKLKSGYNAGVDVSKVKSIEKIDSAKGEAPAAPPVPAENPGLPRVALISTGGTIASKIDYRTGGVKAALSASELYASVPELASHATVDPEVLMSEYSENLTPEHWAAIAEKVAEKVRSGKYSGVVISHGTDTMHYTAAALSFALQGLPVPVVLVGAQRSSDRPSSDAALNMLGATVFAATAGVAGVFVAMHAGTSDDAVAVHVGTRVRKNHTSRRDAFESIDVTPAAIVKGGAVEMQASGIELAPRGRGELKLQSRFDSSVALLKYYPGFDPAMIDSANCKAIILEGTGLGHVNKNCFPSIKKAIEKGVVVCMASQCIWGRVSMTVYDTGRDLLDIGVVPLSDMIAETATAKAMWALANAPNVKKAMQENIAGEISEAIPI